MNWNLRDLRIEQSPAGRGSADHFVRQRFPRELQGLRSKGREQVYLIVMVDGDASGVLGRKTSLSAACEEQGVRPPGDAERVLVCVPTWNIETWLTYLDGETVHEDKQYRKLVKPRDYHSMVDHLVEMCHDQALREPAPASLQDTCTNYQHVFS